MHSIVSGFEFIARGGFMMIPLLLSGLIAFAAILEKLYLFRKIYFSPAGQIQKALDSIVSKNSSAATAICKELNTPASDVILAGIENLERSESEMELAMKNRAEAWLPQLEKRIEIIDTVITAAPLMGLLGTITGMMSSFEVLSEKGVNEPNAITGGVAEALIATATGLLIALVCLLGYNYLNTKIKNTIFELELIGSRLIEIRHRLRGD